MWHCLSYLLVTTLIQEKIFGLLMSHLHHNCMDLLANSSASAVSMCCLNFLFFHQSILFFLLIPFSPYQCFFPLFFHKRSSNFLPFPSLFALSSLSFFVNTLLCWYDCCNFELFPFCSCFLTVLEK